jgi:hypothetical protein
MKVRGSKLGWFSVKSLNTSDENTRVRVIYRKIRYILVTLPKNTPAAQCNSESW